MHDPVWGTWRDSVDQPTEINFEQLQLHDPALKKEFEDTMTLAMPQHSVRITRPYYLQTIEVTIARFRTVLDRIPAGKTADTLPGTSSCVSNISLVDAVLFCDALSK